MVLSLQDPVGWALERRDAARKNAELLQKAAKKGFPDKSDAEYQAEVSKALETGALSPEDLEVNPDPVRPRTLEEEVAELYRMYEQLMTYPEAAAVVDDPECLELSTKLLAEVSAFEIE